MTTSAQWAAAVKNLLLFHQVFLAVLVFSRIILENICSTSDTDHVCEGGDTLYWKEGNLIQISLYSGLGNLHF